MTEPCAFKFDSGNVCGAIPTHVVHRGRWSGPEPNHAYTSVPLSRDDAIRAEATAAAEQRLAGLREALTQIEQDAGWLHDNVPDYSPDGVATLRDLCREIAKAAHRALSDAQPSASPRQGEPVERVAAKAGEYIEAVVTYLDPVNQFTHSRRRHVDRTGEELAELVAAALSEPAEAGEPA